jgi:hypothetical protein
MTQGACSKEKLALLTAHRITDSQSVAALWLGDGQEPLRPFFVAILARNPCLLRRLRLLG